MNLEQLPEAEVEVVEAVDYYEQRRPGLGLEFLAEINRAYQLIADAPERWRRLTRRVRRFLLRGFPYGVIYEVRENMILVVAVMHLSRRPGYWRRRLQ
jgi:plasmid stabilization system protein ParE